MTVFTRHLGGEKEVTAILRLSIFGQDLFRLFAYSHLLRFSRTASELARKDASKQESKTNTDFCEKPHYKSLFSLII